MNDSELLDAARKGDSAAMDELLARHEKQIYRFGLRMCGDEEAAREVLQETLLAAFRGLSAFRGEAELSTWLFQIARSFCMKSHRTSRHAPKAMLSLSDQAALDVPSGAPAPDQRTQAKELGTVVNAAMQALTAEQREAILLRDVEGMSAEEAASIVGVEVGALKSRLHRARMELRANLEALLTEAGAAAQPCEELAAELVRYAASDIDQTTCEAIEKHLESCNRCSVACDHLKRTLAVCRQIPGDEVPVQIRAAVRRSLDRLLTNPPPNLLG